MKVTPISTYLDTIAEGLRCLSSFIKSKGYECEMIFLPDYKALLSYDPQFGRPYEQSLMDDVVQACSDSDVVGIGVMSNFFDHAVQLSKNLRKNLAAPVIWGGIHPTVAPDESLNYCDMVCVGEGEYAMLNLLRPMNVRNMVYRKHYHAFEKSFLNFLVLGAHHGLPRLLMKFLSNRSVAGVLDQKCLRWFWRLVHKFLKSLKRLVNHH